MTQPRALRSPDEPAAAAPAGSPLIGSATTTAQPDADSLALASITTLLGRLVAHLSRDEQGFLAQVYEALCDLLTASALGRLLGQADHLVATGVPSGALDAPLRERWRLLGEAARLPDDDLLFAGAGELSALDALAALERAQRETLAHISPAERLPLAVALRSATLLAGYTRGDAISLAACLLAYGLQITLRSTRERQAFYTALARRLPGARGEATIQLVRDLTRFDQDYTSHFQGYVQARYMMNASELEQASAPPQTAQARRASRKRRERERLATVLTLRHLAPGVSRDPRVVVIKLVEQALVMRGILHEQGESGDLRRESAMTAAQETRIIYAPQAGELGFARLETVLHDLAFAVLEPEAYRRWRALVAASQPQRFIERAVAALGAALAAHGLEASVTGRVKGLYSLHRKARRIESDDLSTLYDIVALRVVVERVEQCYQALNIAHALWRPKDGRFKDYIAQPKPSGYQSLHTTVYCLDDRLAEIQMRTVAMHELAEYRLHWLFKEGDTVSSEDALIVSANQRAETARAALREASLPAGEAMTGEAMTGEATAGQREATRAAPMIFALTPAGDVKELEEGATALDFAYRVHSEVGRRATGARVRSRDARGRTRTREVSLSYRVRTGDVIEVLTRPDAHPAPDWLRIAQTKFARTRIARSLREQRVAAKTQRGRERLDRELRALGLPGGFAGLSEDDLAWLAGQAGEKEVDALLAALGDEGADDPLATLLPLLRARLPLLASGAQAASETTPSPVADPAPAHRASAPPLVASGLLLRLARCCHPLPGDELLGYVSAGRGLIAHRAGCPNIRRLLAASPERVAPLALDATNAAEQTFSAAFVVTLEDHPDALERVHALLATLDLAASQATVTTNARRRHATLTLTFAASHVEQAHAVARELQRLAGVLSVERQGERSTVVRAGQPPAHR